MTSVELGWKMDDFSKHMGLAALRYFHDVWKTNNNIHNYRKKENKTKNRDTKQIYMPSIIKQTAKSTRYVLVQIIHITLSRNSAIVESSVTKLYQSKASFIERRLSLLILRLLIVKLMFFPKKNKPTSLPDYHHNNLFLITSGERLLVL
jgi:hypothetical protein